jgi:hypothetical protein
VGQSREGWDITVLRRAGAVVLAAVAATLLSGCEVKKHYGAECTTSPPVPHQNFGSVEVDVEVSPWVHPGETFDVRVDDMIGYPGPERQGSFPNGVISVTGPVTPSGTFSVGQGIWGGTPYPNLLEFTVTGQPGEEIIIGAESGSSFIGTIPDGFSATCWAGGAEIVTLPIVEADEPS